ncbi:MAG: hypothetical protein HOV81_31720 [Kofleriaceae bacterium]|nr:hypothetical protein [Kofleriaceae bacterium]
MRPLLLVIAIAACSHSKTTVESTRADGATPVETVMVFTNISDPPFAGLMNMGFENQLRAGLAACQVRSEFRQVVEDGGDSMERATASMEAMRTNAALFVKEAGGKVTTYTDAHGENVRSRGFDVWVELELLDRRVNKVTWKALVNYRGFKNGEATMKDGEAFADAVVSRLRSDGMMLGCAGK